MPEEPTMIKPLFQISLTAQQALDLGRLCAIWGQIDHFLMGSVSKLIAVDLAAGVTIMGDMTTGQLVGMLRKSRQRISDESIQNLATKFCDDMGSLIARRNYIMHGIWGWYMPGKSPKKARPACLFVKDPKHPVFADQITSAANHAAEQTYVINQIWCHLHDEPPPSESHPKFFFGEHEPRLPKGMRLTPVARPPKGHPR